MAFLKPPPKSYENFDDDDNHEHDEDNDDAIYFSAKVKCTNDMVSFKKIFKEGDGEDAETAERLRQIGLQFGTLQAVIMLMTMVLMIVVKRLVMMTLMIMITVMTMMTIMTRKIQKP